MKINGQSNSSIVQQLYSPQKHTQNYNTQSVNTAVTLNTETSHNNTLNINNNNNNNSRD